jgi:hypothetical protein
VLKITPEAAWNYLNILKLRQKSSVKFLLARGGGKLIPENMNSLHGAPNTVKQF